MTGYAVETVPPLEDRTPSEMAARVAEAISEGFLERLWDGAF